MTLNFELDKALNEVKKAKAKKVLVQLPEGIKQNAFEIQEEISKLGVEVVFSGETCWGGCSIAVNEARDARADLILHFGHAKFIDVDEKKAGVKIIYIEVRDELNLLPILKKSLPSLKKYKTLGLSYSVQHKHDIPKVIKFYEHNGKKIILSEKIGFAAYEGHVVGCEYGGLKTIQNKVDCFVILGNQFHSMGAAIAVNKPVILLDVYNDDVRSMEGIRDKILKQRIISVEKVKDARKIGILVEVKPGQKFGSPKLLIKKLKDKGKEVIVISISEITPDKLMNFYNIDAFIELACPRIAVDDYAKYNKPIITYREAMVALGEKSWDDLIREGIL